MDRERLGEFEQLLLLAIMRLGEDAFGTQLRAEILERTGRTVSIGAIYPTLDRLEEKGLIESERRPGSSGRGGRPRRYVRLSPRARSLLERQWREFHTMWQGFEPSGASS